MSKSRTRYYAEFRQQMIELVRAGRKPAELSREFGVTTRRFATGSAKPTSMPAFPAQTV
jgi:transposase-like protein